MAHQTLTAFDPVSFRGARGVPVLWGAAVCLCLAASGGLPAQAAAASGLFLPAGARLPAAAPSRGWPRELLHQAQVRGEPDPSLLSQQEPEEQPEGPDDDEGASLAAEPVALSQAVTLAVVVQINQATEACAAVGIIYRTDCIAKELEAVVEKMPSRGGYAPARKALAEASDRLSRLSRQNRDDSQPRLRVTVTADSETRRRPVAAVKPEAAEQTNTRALAILDETTTVLLRSAEGSSDVAVHYQRIAQALNSTKVLLRS